MWSSTDSVCGPGNDHRTMRQLSTLVYCSSSSTHLLNTRTPQAYAKSYRHRRTLRPTSTKLQPLKSDGLIACSNKFGKTKRGVREIKIRLPSISAHSPIGWSLLFFSRKLKVMRRYLYTIPLWRNHFGAQRLKWRRKNTLWPTNDAKTYFVDVHYAVLSIDTATIYSTPRVDKNTGRYVHHILINTKYEVARNACWCPILSLCVRRWGLVFRWDLPAQQVYVSSPRRWGDPSVRHYQKTERSASYHCNTNRKPAAWLGRRLDN